MPTSVPVTPTITEAGLAAIFNAQSTGVEFALTHIAFGTAQYTPDGSETALQAEKVRVTIAGGGRISPTQIQIYAIAQAVAGSPFFVGEVGFFGDDGTTLLAVYSSLATPNLFLSDTVSTSVSYALGLAALPASSVTVTIDPSASAALLLIGQHVAAANPHPQYVEKVNGVAFYDPTLAFDQGAQIIGDDLLVYQSAQANNLGNLPSTSPTWWVPLYNYGDTPVSGLTNANVTLSSTQAARAHITLTGALTSPLNIVFPNWVKDWTVVNDTTGAFALTCKTATGTGVVIPQNGSPTRIRGDGTNITQPAENIAPGTASQHAMQLGQATGRLLNIQVFIASATYTPTVGMTKAVVRVQGGGGAGAGSSVPTSGTVSIGAPGNTGAYAVGQFTAAQIGASQAVTIGAGGTGASNTAGTNGGTSSFGALISAPGGGGGSLLNNVAPPNANGNGVLSSAPAGANIYGVVGGGAGLSIAFSTTAAFGGSGGNSVFGVGGNAPGSGNNGNPGLGYGAGGSGAASLFTGAAQAGGAGKAGIVIVEEYS